MQISNKPQRVQHTMKDISNFADSVNITTNNSIVLLLKGVLIATALVYGATVARQQDGLPKSFLYFLGSVYLYSFVMYVRDRRNSTA